MLKMKRLIAALAATALISPLASANAELIYRLQRYVPELALDLEQFVDDKLDGIILAPNGYSCRLPSKDGFCTIPLIWVTGKDNPASLWRTDADVPSLDRIAVGYDGYVQAYVRYEQELFYELKDGADHSDETLAEATLTAEWDDAWLVTPPPPRPDGQLTANNNGNCEIEANETFCHVRMTWQTQNVENATVWQKTKTGLNRVSEAAPEGSLMAVAFTYPVVYELREGTSESGTMLAAAMTRGFPSEGTGLKPPTAGDEDSDLPDDMEEVEGDVSGNPSCVVNYQRGSCMLPIDYSADYAASLWDARLKTRAGGGFTQGRQSVTVFNYDGARQTPNSFELRVHGNAKPYYTDPMIDRLTVMAIRPNHTGSLTPVSGSDCMINPSRTTCSIELEVQSTSPVVTVWEKETGSLISQVTPPRKVTVTATNGSTSYVLREGTDRRNDILDQQEVTATFRISDTLFYGDQTHCTAPYYGASCSIPVTVTGTEESTLFRRDINASGPGDWQLINGNATNKSYSITIPNVRGPRRIELELRSASDPKKILDSRELTADLGPRHSFTLNRNNLPGQDGEAPCRTYFNSEYCTVGANKYVSWNTSSPHITACFNTGGDGYSRMIRWSKESPTSLNLISLNHYPDRNASYIDFYEGSLGGCPSNQSAGKTSFRLLDTLLFGKAERLSIENTPATVSNNSLRCVVYTDNGTCNNSVRTYLDKMGFSHEKYPALYFTHENGSFLSNAVEGSSVIFPMALGDEDKTYHLRVMKSGNHASSDPIIQTLSSTISRARYSGDLFISAERPTLATMTAGNQQNPNYPPYFRQRTGDDGNQVHGCDIHFGETLCSFYVSFTTSASGAPSLTIDGAQWSVGAASVRRYINPPAVTVTPGKKIVELWDGIPGESEVIDTLEVISSRHDYNVEVPNLPDSQELANFGQISNITFYLQSNTNAYAYNKTTDEVLCEIKFTRSERPIKRGTNCRIQEPAGIYEIEYRLGKSNSSDFEIKGGKSVDIIYRPKGEGEIRPHTDYPQYFTTCPEVYVDGDCKIYFEYKIGSPDMPAGSPTMCKINSSGVILRDGRLNANGQWNKAYTTITRDTEELWVVDGSLCPENILDESKPILIKHSVKSEPVDVDIEYGLIDVLATGSTMNVDEGLVVCNYPAQGENCRIHITAKSLIPKFPGQEPVLYLNAYYRGSLTRLSSIGETFTSNLLNIDQRFPDATYDLSVVACRTGTRINIPASYCKRDSVLKDFIIKGNLPDYTGKITPVDGKTCNVNFEGTSCKIDINIDIDGSIASIYVDGKFVTHFGKATKLHTVSIPLKPNNAPTEVLIRDGYDRNSKHRLLDSIELTALPYDESRFRFTNKPYQGDKHKTLINCAFSGYDLTNRAKTSCSGNINYMSDSTEKNIAKNNSFLKTVKGNGSIAIDGTFQPKRIAHGDSHIVNVWTYTARDRDTGSPLGRMAVYGFQTEIDEKPITILENIKSVTRSTLGVRYYNWNYHVTGYNVWMLDRRVAVDDLQLQAPLGCTSSGSSPSSVCTGVPYLTTKINVGARQLSKYRIGIPSSENKHVKRFYYRVTDTSIANRVSDPVITINGTVRPLIIDNKWHYIDAKDTLGSTLELSIMSADDNSFDMNINWTAEIYDKMMD